MSLGRYFEQAARNFPSSQALCCGDETFTFSQLWDIAKNATLVPGDHAYTGELNSQALLHTYALFAHQKTAIPLHPRLPDSQREELQARIHTAPLPHQTAALLFTSGTTGQPKGVLLSADALIAAAKASAIHLGTRAEDHWLLALPYAHVGGLSILVRGLVDGSAVIVAPGGFEPQTFTDCIDARGITRASIVPTQLVRLVRAKLKAPTHLRTLLVGGAACSESVVHEARVLGWPVLLTYGMTETCGQVATQKHGHEEQGLYPLPHARFDTKEARLYVAASSLFSGYLGEPPRSDGAFCTQDMAELTPEGCLKVLGRADDVINTGGEKVMPQRVENALLEHPGISEAAVLGQPSDEYGQLVVAVVVASALAVDAWVGFLRTRLASFEIPKRWFVVPELPKTHLGKVDRAVLHRRYGIKGVGHTAML